MIRFDRLDLNNGVAEALLQELNSKPQKGLVFIVKLYIHFLSTCIRWSYMKIINLNCRMLYNVSLSKLKRPAFIKPPRK